MKYIEYNYTEKRQKSNLSDILCSVHLVRTYQIRSHFLTLSTPLYIHITDLYMHMRSNFSFKFMIYFRIELYSRRRKLNLYLRIVTWPVYVNETRTCIPQSFFVTVPRFFCFMAYLFLSREICPYPLKSSENSFCSGPSGHLV